MASDIEMKPESQESSDGVQAAITHDEELKTPNGLAQHMENPQTAEEIKAEKRFVLKVDLMILPLLVLSVFLASLVRTFYFTLTQRLFTDNLCVPRIAATLAMRTTPEWPRFADPEGP